MKMHFIGRTKINVCLVIGLLAASIAVAQNPIQKLNATTLYRGEDASGENMLLSGDYDDAQGMSNMAANRAGSSKSYRDRNNKYSLSDLRRNLTRQKISERQGDDPIHRNPIHLISHKIKEIDVSC